LFQARKRRKNHTTPTVSNSDAATGTTATDAKGHCMLKNLPAGLVTASAIAPGYDEVVIPVDLQAGSTGTANFELRKHKEGVADLEKSIGQSGTAAIYGVHFDTGSATLRPDSAAALQNVLALIDKMSNSKWIISGHTDNQGAAALNEKLSQDRAASVIAWLAAHGVDAKRLTPQGFGASRPVADNAIYHLVRAVDRISHYEFPVQLNDASRAYFAGMAKVLGGENGAAMLAVLKNPQDAAAVAILDKNVNWHAMLRTTCVATMLSAGHATNALPQRARANINCRIFPGDSLESVRATLLKLVDDPAVSVTVPEIRGPIATPAPLTPQVLKPVEQVAAELWPGVPVIPTLEPGATDAQFLNPAGIPTYGVDGFFVDPDGGNIHGLNERIRVTSVYEGRTFLYRLIKIYANQ